MPEWSVSELPLGNGVLGISPIPGRQGNYTSDFNRLALWGPSLVLTMTTSLELSRVGADGLADDLAALGVAWRHLPIIDFGAPGSETEPLWSDVSLQVHEILAEGGKVLTHCFGGCGRSGMITLRVMVEAGEDAEKALTRLRLVRPCAVETDAQSSWAAAANGAQKEGRE